MDSLTAREKFLTLSWEDQKATDLRKVLDPDTSTDLTANCVSPAHRDDTASMVIYSNAVYCFGCKQRYWPDVFLRVLGDRPLETERGARKQPAPKYIPLTVPYTYMNWLWGVHGDGHYSDRQKWLLDRGLTRETCTNNYIGHTGEAYSIPVFTTPEDPGVHEHKVQSIRYRRDDGMASEDRPKYWGTAGANQALLYVPTGMADKTQYGLILCEGELDALRLVQEGYPAVSLTNGCNALKQEHLPKILKLARKFQSRMTICYDQDLPGRTAATRALMLLFGTEIQTRVLAWPPTLFGKDVTEYFNIPGNRETAAQMFKSKLDRLWQSGS